MGGRIRRRSAIAVAVALLAGVGVLHAPAGDAAPARRLKYVALGDSYTSAPLVLPQDTSHVPQDCGQSVQNYPHLVAKAIHATSFVDVSCGGATLANLTQREVLPLGTSNGPQLRAVTADTDVVTMGLGGNDVNFVGFTSFCSRAIQPVQPRCTPSNAGTESDRVVQRIRRTEPKVGEAIELIRRKAPHAAIFVIGYPAALPDNAKACWPYVPIPQADMPWVVARYKDMNAMLARAAAAHGATYVDTYTSSIGHDACQYPGTAWVNWLLVVPPASPAHPNQLGQAQEAKDVTRAIARQLG